MLSFSFLIVFAISVFGTTAIATSIPVIQNQPFQYSPPFFAAIEYKHRHDAPFGHICILLAADGSFLRLFREGQGPWSPMDGKFNDNHMSLEPSLVQLRGGCEDLLHPDNVTVALEAVLPIFIPSLTSEQMREFLASPPSLGGGTWLTLSTLLTNLSIPRSNVGQIVETTPPTGFRSRTLSITQDVWRAQVCYHSGITVINDNLRIEITSRLRLTLESLALSPHALAARFNVKLIFDILIDCQLVQYKNRATRLLLSSSRLIESYGLELRQDQSNFLLWRFDMLRCGMRVVDAGSIHEYPTLAEKIHQAVDFFNERYSETGDLNLLLLGRGSGISLAELCNLLQRPFADDIELK